MKYFADIQGYDLAQILGVFVILLAGFYGFAYKQMKDARAERAEERAAFTQALQSHADAQKLVATALDKNTIAIEGSIEQSGQVIEFMQNLNGELKNAARRKLGK